VRIFHSVLGAIGRCVFTQRAGGGESFLERERAQLPLWLVVGFGAGIASWFALDGSGEWLAVICIGAGLAVAGFSFEGGRLERAIGWVGLSLALGCGLIWLRSEWVAAPRLERPVVTTFEASVEQVEVMAAKGDLRLTLATSDPALPPSVRVSMKADSAPGGISTGARLRVSARLAPAPPMALPGTHDFARDAWFRGIGGVGRALGEVEVLAPGKAGGLDSVRDRLGRHIREQFPDSPGSIATALVTGDQNAVSEDDTDAMRRSGLAHLLSVSGLHIAAVVGAAMFLALKLLALSGRLALRLNLVLVAAGAGAVAGIGYTLVTGAQVPDDKKLCRSAACAWRDSAGARGDKPEVGSSRGCRRAYVPSGSIGGTQLPVQLRRCHRHHRPSFLLMGPPGTDATG